VPTYQQRIWQPRPDGLGGRRDRESFAYDAYVPDPLASLEVRLSPDDSQAVLEAERAVAELQVGSQFAGLEALSRQLLRAESVASSRIEGLTLSQRRLAEALLSPSDADAAAREVVGNVDAMQAAIALGSSGEPIDTADLVALHRTLFAKSRHSYVPGRLRTEQNWIGGSDLSPRGADFVPPPENLVTPLLSDLSTYSNRVDVSAVVQAAVAHAQFETIHPFPDGNGRVGRALIHVILRRRGLSSRLVPPISIVLAANGGRYVESLTAFRDGRSSEWCVFFARVVTDASRRSQELATDLARVQGDWLERAGRPRSDSAAARLIGVIPAHPVLDARLVATTLNVSAVAARNALNALEAAHVLQPIVFGKQRYRAWEAPDLIAVLDNFEWSMAEPTRSGQPRRPAPRRR
jgi:Fic family protein